MINNNTNKRARLRIDESLWTRMRDFHLRPGKTSEALSYAWARCERVRGGLVVLMPADTPYFALADECHERVGGAQVRLRPDVLNGMLVEFARSDYNCLVNIHDHWFSQDADFSSVDDADDSKFEEYLRTRFEPSLRHHPHLGPSRHIYNLSMVLGQRSHAARLAVGRNVVRLQPVDQIALIGTHWSTARLSRSQGNAHGVAGASNLARHQGFITEVVQQRLAALHIAVVGCGGLGSIAAESLARLGVGRLTLVDGDRLESTNLNRWQGAVPDDVGRPKAQLLAERVRAMVPTCEVAAVSNALETPRSLLAIAGADMILAGLDNDPARYLLNHLALQHLLPYFDLGVGITTEPHPEFAGRYFAVLPGVTACVECTSFNLLDQNEILRHFTNPVVQAERKSAGYVLDHPDDPAPSAYLLNQRTVALGVQELLNFIAGWRATATVAHELWCGGTIKRADRENFPEKHHEDCPLCSSRLGRGWLLPLPKRPAALHDVEFRNPHIEERMDCRFERIIGFE